MAVNETASDMVKLPEIEDQQKYIYHYREEEERRRRNIYSEGEVYKLAVKPC